MIEIRPLMPDDADKLREIRLAALRKDGRCFTANLSDEEAFTKAQWRMAATETTGQVTFGAFADGELVGIMGARVWERDATEKTAYWRALYIVPKFRHSTVGQDLFLSTDVWSRAHGFTSAVFTIHPENNGALSLVKKHDAHPFGDEPLRFADGKIANAIWFRKILDSQSFDI